MKVILPPAICAALLLLPLPSLAAERVALVIGNNAYQHAAPLNNCVNDARAMSDKLKEAQFSVLLVEDATAEKMHESLEKFQEMSRGCQVGLVFYAGHGLEEDGKNYLVPVDAVLERKAQLPLQTLSLAQVLDAMKEARIPAKIVLLDSCRNMPLSRGWRATRGIGGGGLAGLQSSDLPESTLVYYSTAPGQVASDEGSEGKHSPFTQGLLTTMSKPGIHALEALNQVEDSVQEQTQGKQRPKLFNDGETGVFRKFSFAGGGTGTLTLVPPPAPPIVPIEPLAVPTPPAPPVSPPVVLPACGFFDLDQLYHETHYSTYNDYSKKQILRRVQEQLKAHRLYAGTLDGNMGLNTQRAILEWQRSQGLAPTGRIDDRTQLSLGVSGIGESQTPSRPAPARQSQERQPKPTPAPKPKPVDDFFRDT